MKQEKRRGLGRGLSALMADVEQTPGETGEAPRRADQGRPGARAEVQLELKLLH